MSEIKQEAVAMIERLPDNISWNDLAYHFYVRSKIEAGLRDIESGQVISHAEVKKNILSGKE